MEPVSTALLAASVGQGLWSAFSGGRRRRKQKKRKSQFFDANLKPLLDEATEEQDVDYESLYGANMEMPLMNLQQGMRSLAKSKDSTYGQSGFQSSSFIDDEFTNQYGVAENQFDNQKFEVQRGLIDLQSQMESITSENKLRAKELEYQYKYS